MSVIHPTGGLNMLKSKVLYWINLYFYLQTEGYGYLVDTVKILISEVTLDQQPTLSQRGRDCDVRLKLMTFNTPFLSQYCVLGHTPSRSIG